MKRGETLSMIAGNYGTSVEAVRDANGLKRKSMLSVGQTLMIPVSGASANPDLANSKPQYMIPTNGVDRAALDRYAQRAAANYVAPANTSGKKKITYKVRSGDTLGEIAEQYHTSVDRIRSWNDLSRRRHIYAGQRLAIYVSESYQQAEVRDTASAAGRINRG